MLTRFGPLHYNIEKADGAFFLCAVEESTRRAFDEITEQVNRYDEVAHNYQREHEWNMWFVLAHRKSAKLLKVLKKLCRSRSYPGLNLPNKQSFCGVKALKPDLIEMTLDQALVKKK